MSVIEEGFPNDDAVQARDKRSRRSPFYTYTQDDTRANANTGSHPAPLSFYSPQPLVRAKSMGKSVTKEYQTRLQQFGESLCLVPDSFLGGLGVGKNAGIDMSFGSGLRPLFDYRREHLAASFPEDPYEPVKLFNRTYVAIDFTAQLPQLYDKIIQGITMVECLNKMEIDTQTYSEPRSAASLAVGTMKDAHLEILRCMDFLMWTILRIPAMVRHGMMKKKGAITFLSSTEEHTQTLFGALPHIHTVMSLYRGLPLNRLVYCMIDMKWRAVEIILYINQARVKMTEGELVSESETVSTDETMHVVECEGERKVEDVNVEVGITCGSSRMGQETTSCASMARNILPVILKNNVFTTFVTHLTRELVLLYCTHRDCLLGIWDKPAGRPKQFPLVEVWSVLLLAINECTSEPWQVLTTVLSELVAEFDISKKNHGKEKCGKNQKDSLDWVSSLKLVGGAKVTASVVAKLMFNLVLTMVGIATKIAARGRSRHFGSGLTHGDWAIVTNILPLVHSKVGYEKYSKNQHRSIHIALQTILALSPADPAPGLLTGGKDLLPKVGTLFKDVRFALCATAASDADYQHLLVMHKANYKTFMELIYVHLKSLAPEVAHERLRKISAPLLRALPSKVKVKAHATEDMSTRFVTHVGLAAVNELVLKLALFSPPSQLRNLCDRISGMIDISESDPKAHKIIVQSLRMLMRFPLAKECDESTLRVVIKSLCDILASTLESVSLNARASNRNPEYTSACVKFAQSTILAIRDVCCLGDGRTFAHLYAQLINTILTNCLLQDLRGTALSMLRDIVAHRRTSPMHTLTIGDPVTLLTAEMPFATMKKQLAQADIDAESQGSSFDPFGEDMDEDLLQNVLAFEAEQIRPTYAQEKDEWTATDNLDIQILHTHVTGVVEKLARQGIPGEGSLAPYARCMTELYIALVENGLRQWSDAFAIFGVRILTDPLRVERFYYLPMIFIGRLLSTCPSACSHPEARAVAVWIMAIFSRHRSYSAPLLVPMTRQSYHPLYAHSSEYTDTTEPMKLLRDFCLAVRDLYSSVLLYATTHYEEARALQLTLAKYFEFAYLMASNKGVTKGKEKCTRAVGAHGLSLILLYCSKLLSSTKSKIDASALFALALKLCQSHRDSQEQQSTYRRLLYGLHDSEKVNCSYYTRQVIAVVQGMRAFDSDAGVDHLCQLVQDPSLATGDELLADMAVLGSTGISSLRHHFLTSVIEHMLLSPAIPQHTYAHAPTHTRHTTTVTDHAATRQQLVLKFVRCVFQQHLVVDTSENTITHAYNSTDTSTRSNATTSNVSLEDNTEVDANVDACMGLDVGESGSDSMDIDARGDSNVHRTVIPDYFAKDFTMSLHTLIRLMPNVDGALRDNMYTLFCQMCIEYGNITVDKCTHTTPSNSIYDPVTTYHKTLTIVLGWSVSDFATAVGVKKLEKTCQSTNTNANTNQSTSTTHMKYNLSALNIQILNLPSVVQAEVEAFFSDTHKRKENFLRMYPSKTGQTPHTAEAGTAALSIARAETIISLWKNVLRTNGPVRNEAQKRAQIFTAIVSHSTCAYKNQLLGVFQAWKLD
eukprot:CFRG4138T1